MKTKELMEGRMDVHPFEGGKKASSITKKHRPLVWEGMLGTVYATDFKDQNLEKEAEYFDYNWDKARKYAGVDKMTDLRVFRNKNRYNSDYEMHGPSVGKLALWGIPPWETK